MQDLYSTFSLTQNHTTVSLRSSSIAIFSLLLSCCIAKYCEFSYRRKCGWFLNFVHELLSAELKIALKQMLEKQSWENKLPLTCGNLPNKELLSVFTGFEVSEAKIST